jgi:uncharacterized protein (DUF736 family)
MAENKPSIGALWERTAKSGTVYLTGNIEFLGKKIDVVIFRNNKGDNEKRPDYKIYESEKREAPAGSNADIPF